MQTLRVGIEVRDMITTHKKCKCGAWIRRAMDQLTNGLCWSCYVQHMAQYIELPKATIKEEEVK